MEFFIRYAEAIEQAAIEQGSTINDVLVDIETLLQKETTATTNDTSNPSVVQPQQTRPTEDGIMPHKTKPPFQPRSTESDPVKLRDVCPRKSSKLESTGPQELKNNHSVDPVRITRKKTGLRAKDLGRK